MKNPNGLAELKVDIERLGSVVDQLRASQCAVNHPSASSQCAVTAQCGACPVRSPFVPDYSIPLLAPGGGNCNPEILAKLGPLAGLIGTWVSPRFNGYNVMPIPQATAPDGFILKNFFYYEVITFSAIQGKVANRGGTDEQDSYTLFYEQRVFFADGPQANTLVHAENGAWLHLITGPQGQGPLDIPPNIPSPPAPDPIPPQDPAREIVKQVSVPHGNSILAMGGVATIYDAPAIPDVSALPVGAPASYSAPYGNDVPGNPNINPNIVLQEALLALHRQGGKVVRTQVINVDSANAGSVTNTPFIQSHTNVTQYANTLWLEELSSGYLMLQYSQNISLKFPQANGGSYLFPHITANTLLKVG